eukprot:12382713-Alexandrium_andersonii.AAC.1
MSLGESPEARVLADLPAARQMSKLDCLTKALAADPPDLGDLSEPVVETFKNLVDRAKVAL